MKKRNFKKFRTKVISGILTAALSVPLVIAGLQANTQEVKAANNDWYNWLEENTYAFGGSDGATAIKFYANAGVQNAYKSSTEGQNHYIKKYWYKNLEQKEMTITLPNEDQANFTADNYKGPDGESNYELAGWYLLDGKGGQVFYNVGESVSLTNDMKNVNGEVEFYAYWKVKSYDYGSNEDTALGGVMESIKSTGINTTVYDYDWRFNIPNIERNGKEWKDSGTGLLFLDLYNDADSPVVWPESVLRGKNGAFLNRWTGDGGLGGTLSRAAQDGWTYVEGDVNKLFNDDTLGVTKLGDSSGGSYFYKVTEGPDKGYYVYDSAEHGAVYNQSEQKFYVYNKPQNFVQDGDIVRPGFFPLNNATDNDREYQYNNSTINYHFGTKTELEFILTADVEEGKKANQIEIDGEMKDQIFYFNGDDDVWVFIDREEDEHGNVIDPGRLLLDIGGIHSITEGEINFSTGEAHTWTTDANNRKVDKAETDVYGLTRGKHKLTIYYLERGGNASNNLTKYLLNVPTDFMVQKLETQTGEAAAFSGASFYLIDEKDRYYAIVDGMNDDGTPKYKEEFTYTGKDDENTVITSDFVDDKKNATLIKADDEGRVYFVDIIDGRYRLVEQYAPDYYEGLPGSFHFTLQNAKLVSDTLAVEADDEYWDKTRPWETDDLQDLVSVDQEAKEVTLEVGNERKTKPLEIEKQFGDNREPAGVEFEIYEVNATLKDDGTIDNGEGKIKPTLPNVAVDAGPVYTGFTDAEGKVTNYTWYPNGANKTAESKIKRNLDPDMPELKEGSIYYIVEKFTGDDASKYYEIADPIVLAVGKKEASDTESKIYRISDPTTDRFKFKGVESFNFTEATGDENAQLDITNVPIETDKPIKKLNDNDQQKAEERTVTDEEGNAVTDENGEEVKETVTVWDPEKLEELPARDTVFTYTITQKIPINTSKIVITDTLEDVLEIVGTPTVNDNPFGVFNIKVEGNAVTLTGDDATITDGNTPIFNMGKNDSSVTLTIRAKIRDDVTDEQLKEKYDDTTNIPNKATVQLNNDTEVETNEVKLTPPVPGEEPEKSVINTDSTLDEQAIILKNRDDEYTYVIEQKVPAKASTITIVDELESVLEFVGSKDTNVSVKVITGEGDDRTEEDIKNENGVDIKKTSRKLTVTLTDEAATKAASKKVRIEFKAKIKDNITDEQLLKAYKETIGEEGSEDVVPTTKIPNKAEVTIDGKHNWTNEVTVTPPPTPQKTVNSDVHYVLENKDEEFVYEIKQFVPLESSEIIIEDTLSEYLDFVGSYTIKAVDALDGTEEEIRTENIDKTAEKLEITINDEETLNKLHNKYITVTFKAVFDENQIDNIKEDAQENVEEKIYEEVNDNGIVKTGFTDHTGVPNEAKVVVIPSNENNYTNKVTVRPPSEHPGTLRISKRLDAQSDEAKGKSFTFRVKLTAPEGKNLDNVNCTVETNANASDTEGSSDTGEGQSGEDSEGGEDDSEPERPTESESVELNFDENGVATITIMDGQTAVITGIPGGATYEVTEDDLADFEETLVNEKGKIAADTESFVTAINKEIIPPEGKLDILKVVNGAADDIQFTFEIELTPAGTEDGAEPEPIDFNAIQVKIGNGEAQPATVEDGKIVVKIGKNETAHLTGIPEGAHYVVKERPATGYSRDEEAGYQEEGDIVGSDTATAVIVNTPEPPEKPEKLVGSDEENLSKDKLSLEERNKEYTYGIRQLVPLNAIELEFTDNLESVLEYVYDKDDDGKNNHLQLKIYHVYGDKKEEIEVPDNSDGENVEQEVTVSVDAQKLTVTIKGEKATEVRSTEDEKHYVEVVFNAKIKEGITDAALVDLYQSTEIPNEAVVKVNNTSNTSNKVLVTPPPENQKSVNGDVHYVLDNATDTFEYKITSYVPTDAASVTFSDELSTYLDFADGVIATANGSAVGRSAYRLSQANKMLQIDFIDLSAVRGKVVEVIFEAKFADDYIDENGNIKADKLEEIKAAYKAVDANGLVTEEVGEHSGIDNTGLIVLDGKDNPTNTVTVVPPGNDPGNLVVSKSVTPANPDAEAEDGGLTDEEKNAEFEFVVTLTDGEGNNLSEEVLSALKVEIDGEEADATVNNAASTVTFKVKHGQSAKIIDVPAYTKYHVEENAAEGFELVTINGNDGAVRSNSDQNVYITNRKTPPPPPGSLNVLKTLKGDAPEGYENQKFKIEIRFLDQRNAVLNPLDIEEFRVNGKEIDASSMSGSWLVVELEANEEVSISGLPEGTKYTARENLDGIEVFELDEENQINWTGTINDATVTAVFQNVPVTPPADPEKKINGKNHEDLGDKSTEFTYTVSQFIPLKTTVVTFEDTLNDVLEFAGEATVTGGSLNKKLAPGTTLAGEENAKTLSFTLTEAEAAQVAGNVMTVTFGAKFIDGLTDDTIEDSYIVIRNDDGTTLYTGTPNEAKTVVGDHEGTTNTVTVTAPPDVEKPEKTINNGRPETPRLDADENEIKDEDGNVIMDPVPVKLSNREAVFTYGVSQQLPEKLRSVTFSDTLESVLEFNGRNGNAKIVDGEDNDVTGSFTISIDGQTIRAVAKSDALEDFAGKKLTFTFTAKIKSGVTDEQLLAQYAGSTDIPNTATVNINGSPIASNTVKVTPPPEGSEPEKSVKAEHEEEAHKGTAVLNARNEKFTYSIDQKVPVSAESIAFTDKLEEVLTADILSATLTTDAVERDEEGNDTDTVVTIDVKPTKEDENGRDVVKAEINDKDLLAKLAGKTVTLTFSATIKDSVTDVDLYAKYGKTLDIPNEAEVSINGDNPLTTNKVFVTPPPEEPKEPEKKVNDVKAGTDEDAESRPIELTKRQEKFTYAVSQEVPALAKSLTFIDVLEDVLETDATRVTLADEDGNDLTSVANINVNGTSVIATYSDEEALKDLIGKKIILTIEANLKSGVTDAELIAKYGQNKEVPNEATILIDGKPQTTNEVKVIPPNQPEDPKKGVEGLDEEGNVIPALTTDAVTLTNRAQQFKYTVSQLVPDNADTVGFKDEIAEVLDVISASVDGEAEYTNVSKDNVIEFTTDDATKDRGKTVTLTIIAKINDDVTDEVLIEKYGTTTVENTAEVSIDGNPVPTNTVKVTPPPEEEPENPEKKVEGEDIYDLPKPAEDADTDTVAAARAKEFTYTISQKVPKGAVELKYTDTLRKYLEFFGDDAAVKLYDEDGNEVKADISIDADTKTITAVTSDEAQVKGLEGKTVIFEFKAKLENGVTDQQLIDEYGNTRVPNQATVEVNGRGKATNTVYVLPPETPGEKPEKFVNDTKAGTDDDAETEPVKLESKYKTFTYTIAQKLGDDAEKVTVTDTIANVLEFVDNNGVAQSEEGFDADNVVTIEGKAAYRATIEGNKLTVETEDATADRNSEIKVTFTAKVKKGISDSQLVALYGEKKEIPNTATVSINNNPKITNEVKVIPPDSPETKDPAKGVEGLDEDGNVIPALEGKVELTNRTDVITYTVSQEIPEDAIIVTFQDILERVLGVEGTPTLTDSKGNSVGTPVVTGGRVVNATINDEAKLAELAGETVTLTIRAKIKDDVTDAQLIALYGESREIPNEATVSVDGDPKTTNEVKVTPPEEPENPEKKINGDTKLVTLTDREEEFEYSVSQLIPSNAKTVTITDTLEKELEVVDGSASIDVDGVTPSVNNGVVTVEINDVQEKGLAGKTVTLTFKAKIKTEVKDSELLAREGNYTKTTIIPNTAEVAFNFEDAPRSTNTVEVTPPPTPSEEPEKNINGAKDTVVLENRDDEFTYTITQLIPAGAINVVIEDELKTELEIVGEPTVDNGFTVNVDGNKVTATIEDATALADKTVTLTIKAKIKSDVTDKVLIDKYKSTVIDNKATVKINGNPKSTNEVKVTPPPTPGENPEKKVEGKEAHELTSRTNEFTYTITQKIPDDATKVEFADTIESVLEFVEGSASTDAKAAYDISISGQTITAKTEDAEADRGAEVTLTFKARIKSGVTDAQLIAQYGEDKKIPNKAIVTIDDNPKVSNEVTVTPPPSDRQDPVKTVDKPELTGKNEEFVYTVSQLIPDGAKNVVFEDNLKDVLEVVKTEIAADGEALGADVATVTVAANNRDVRAEIADATDLAGKTVALKITAKIKDGVTDEELIRNYGTERKIPNKANVIIDGQGKPTNEVTVTPPPDEEIEKPEKLIEGTTALTLNEGERTKEFTYTVTQKIPAGAKNVILSDTLERVLKVNSAEFSVEGITPEVSGQVVSVTIADASALEGQTVTLTIKAQIREGVSDEELIADYGQGMNIPNKATINIDGKQLDSNEVTVTPPTTPPTTPPIVKKVNGVNDAKLDATHEVFHYNISTVVPQNADKFVITDELEPIVDFAGDVVVTVNGEELAIANVNGKVLSVEVPDVRSRAGQIVSIDFDAVIADGTTEDEISAYADRKIPNKASYVINDNPAYSKESEPVTVNPPVPTNPDLSKEVKRAGESDWGTHKNLADTNEVYSYRVTTKIPVGADSFELTDTLDALLKAPAAGDVNVEIDGTPVNGVVSVNGNTITVALDKSIIEANEDATLVVTFDTNINVDDAQLAAVYADRTVPNTASLILNNDVSTRKNSNPVTVTPPTPDSVGSVRVRYVYYDENGVLQELETWSFVRENEKADTPYSTIQKNFDGYRFVRLDEGSEPVNGVVVADKVLDVVYVYEPVVPDTPKGSVTVIHVAEDGTVLKDTTDVVRNADDGTEYTTSQETFPGYEFVKVDENHDPASGTVEGGKTKEVVYIYKPVVPELEKLVNGVKPHYDLKRNFEAFTYTIKAKIPVNAATFTITDTLVPVLEFASDTVTVLVDGSAVENAASINGQTLTVTLPANIVEANGYKDVEVDFTAVIREGANLEAYKASPEADALIPNTAEYTFTDKQGQAHDPIPSNEVTVTPPSKDVELPNFDPNEIRKFVTTSKTDKNGSHGDLATRQEVYTYTLETQIAKNAEALVIEDILVDELTFASGSNDVKVTVDGVDISAGLRTRTIDGQKLTVELTLDQLIEYEGKVVTIEFKANVKDGADLSKYSDAQGNIQVPNSADMYVNGSRDAIKSNVVTVTPPSEGRTTLGLSISKRILGGSDELPGAKLAVYYREADGSYFEIAVPEWTSSDVAHLVDLPDGEYVLVETQAPEGYEIAGPIAFRISGNGTVLEVLVDGNWVSPAELNTIIMYDAKKDVPKENPPVNPPADETPTPVTPVTPAQPSTPVTTRRVVTPNTTPTVSKATSTGDTNNASLWIIIGAIAAAAIIGAGIAMGRRRRD